MKHKRKLEEKNNPYVFVGIGLGLMFFYMKTKQELINYPNQYVVFGIVLFSFSLVLFNYKKIFNVNLLETGLNMIRYVLVAWIVVGVLFIPFNYYLIQSTKESKAEYLLLPLVKVSTNSQNRCFFYLYNDKKFVYYDYDPRFENILRNKNYEDFQIQFKVKKGEIGVFRIMDWDLKEIGNNANL